MLSTSRTEKKLHKSISIEQRSHQHNGVLCHYHVVSGKDTAMTDVYSVDSKIIEKWNTIPPTQPEESACKYNEHRQYIDHYVDEYITRLVAFEGDNHLHRMPCKLYHSIHMCEHYHNRYVFAEPLKELQYTSIVPIAAPH